MVATDQFDGVGDLAADSSENNCLGRGTCLDGQCLYLELPPLRSRALPLHRAVSAGNDPARAGHGTGLVPLGPDGWLWLGLTIGVGSGSIWCLSEKLMGRYR